MPSAKPDLKEVHALRQRRGYDSAPTTNFYTELYERCALAVAGGYTSEARSLGLLQYLESNPRIAAIFPNNALTQLLKHACAGGTWCSEYEHDVLHLIHSLYLGYESRSDSAVTTVLSLDPGKGEIVVSREIKPIEPRPPQDLAYILGNLRFKTPRLKSTLLVDHLDSLETVPDLREQFVGFTGKFEFGTRALCYAEARKHGAVPCDQASYMDYLFVCQEFEERGAISSSLDLAIFYRRIYGRPVILSERVWNVIVSGG